MDDFPCEPESLPSYILKSMCKTLPSFPEVSVRAHLCVFDVNKAEKLDKALRKITTDRKEWTMEKDCKVFPQQQMAWDGGRGVRFCIGIVFRYVQGCY